MIPQDFLTQLAQERGISGNELEVLSRALSGQSLAAISKELGVRKDALQKRLGEVYKKFQIAGAGTGKLARLQQQLLTAYQKSQQAHPPAKRVPPAPPTQTPGFVGRERELTCLHQWVQQGKQLIWITGIAGIGKTALVQQLQQCLGAEFAGIYESDWQNGQPSLEAWLREALHETPHHATSATTLESLLSHLSRYRCLLILDGIESLWYSSPDSKVTVSAANAAIRDSRSLLATLATTQHQSCCIITSWLPPDDWLTWMQSIPPIQYLELEGLTVEDAQALLQSFLSVPLDVDVLKEWIHLYGSHPFLLTLAAKQLQTASGMELLKTTTLKCSRHIQSVLDTAANPSLPSLTALEKRIIEALALHSQQLTFAAIYSTVSDEEAYQTAEVQDALASLIKKEQIAKHLTTPVTYRLTYPLRQEITRQFLAKFLNQRGHQHYFAGNFASAYADLRLAVRYHPRLNAALYNLGAACEQLQDWSQARHYYQQVNRQENSNAVHAAISNQARLLILEGCVKNAVDEITAILEQVEDAVVKSALHKNLGWAYYIQKNYDAAMTQLQAALDLNPNLSAAYYLIAQVLTAQGNGIAARQAWSEALNCDQRQRENQNTPWRLPEMELWRMQALQQRTEFP